MTSRLTYSIILHSRKDVHTLNRHLLNLLLYTFSKVYVAFYCVRNRSLIKFKTPLDFYIRLLQEPAHSRKIKEKFGINVIGECLAKEGNQSKPAFITAERCDAIT